MTSNEQWQALMAEFERIANDPNETRERRVKARDALQKAGRGSVVRGSNSQAWSERQKNNYSKDSRVGGTA